jgi:hypothetical protein
MSDSVVSTEDKSDDKDSPLDVLVELVVVDPELEEPESDESLDDDPLEDPSLLELPF